MYCILKTSSDVSFPRSLWRYEPEAQLRKRKIIYTGDTRSNRAYAVLNCSVMYWLCATPWTVAHQAPLSMGFSRQEYWSGLPLLQGIFPNQGSNQGLPHCRQILYHLSHCGSPWILEWVAHPFSRGRTSQSRNWNRDSCIAGGIFTTWATREPQGSSRKEGKGIFWTKRKK